MYYEVYNLLGKKVIWRFAAGGADQSVVTDTEGTESVSRESLFRR